MICVYVMCVWKDYKMLGLRLIQAAVRNEKLSVINLFDVDKLSVNFQDPVSLFLSFC